jgi:drug/metabolite transporter (DMT)-like permease
MDQRQWKAAGCALLAAALYALSAPLAKLLLREMPGMLMAALLYLGAGLGMAATGMCKKRNGSGGALRLARAERPYAVWMVLLDMAAPALLMLGLKETAAANASLLNNFEIVVTATAAMLFFGEAVSRRLWLAIALITLSSAILSFECSGSLQFSRGSALVLLASACWGFENNCTRRLSANDPMKIVVVKGIGSGLGNLVIALALGEAAGRLQPILGALLLGFVAYGLSIYFYVLAQRALGAAKTSAYYAAAPFIGVMLSFLIFRDAPGASFWVALGLMAAGVFYAATDAQKARA